MLPQITTTNVFFKNYFDYGAMTIKSILVKNLYLHSNSLLLFLLSLHLFFLLFLHFQTSFYKTFENTIKNTFFNFRSIVPTLHFDGTFDSKLPVLWTTNFESSFDFKFGHFSPFLITIRLSKCILPRPLVYSILVKILHPELKNFQCYGSIIIWPFF